MTLTNFDFEKPVTELEEELKRQQDAYQKLVLKKRAADAKLKAEQEAEAEKRAAEGETAPDPGDESIDARTPIPNELHAPEPTEDEVDPKLARRIHDLEERLNETRGTIYANLTPWQRVQVARHPSRPHALDYIRRLVSDWIELRGDREFGDDQSVVTGLGRFADRPVALIGQQKGIDTKDNIHRNFGMMHPEGYRKARRVMQLAEKFNMPVLIFIDTPGAYPGIGAEERGQGEAIGRNIMEMSMLRVPILCTVIGEGASGGALGIGIGDRLLMLKYAWYCVISPEGCASILYRDASKAPQAADALKLTADDLLGFKVIDEIVEEPIGGAHRDPMAAADFLRDALNRHLEELLDLPTDRLLEQRYDKYRRMGEQALTSLEQPSV